MKTAKVKPVDSHTFDGFGNVARDRAEAFAVEEGKHLTERLKQPAGDVSRKSGFMERDSPLFHGSGANPGLF